MTISDNTFSSGFTGLKLSSPVQKALIDAGYDNPTPIQERCIPHLLAGRDMIGQAQTGTGKTAAFALPLLSNIDTSSRAVQALVLTPTRELAKQVAEGFTKYSKHMKELGVLAVYGGQDYDIQLRALRKGVHVVIGTPGRVMDHMRRGTLRIDHISNLVLDEADEMLRMGFIDDVDWILEHTPSTRQTALFSATMPSPIRRIAKTHLNNPQEIIIESRITAAVSIRQRYLVCAGAKKIDALIRILEMEDTDGVIVFVKTKTGTVDVTEKLLAEGYDACALNGDLSQNLRERTVGRLKNGKLKIIVATDVAARGLDVERISHVFNYDVPNDAETYVHRIGRTGRAGKTGDAILFLTPKDRRILNNISNATRQPIEAMNVPSTVEINNKRVDSFNQKITEALASKDLSFFKEVIDTYCEQHDASRLDVAAAVATILRGDTPLLLDARSERTRSQIETSFSSDRKGEHRSRKRRDERPKGRTETRPAFDRPERDMERYRIEVGNVHAVKASNIVGAIANEIGLDSAHIGKIDIYDDHSTVDLPAGMPRKIRRLLKTVWVCSTQMNISKLDDSNESDVKNSRRTHKPSDGTHPTPKSKKSRQKNKKTPHIKAERKTPKKAA